MSVRAKFRVASITEQADYSGQPSKTKVVKLACIYDQSIPEDQRFFDATPSGTVEMWINNPAALEQFALGKAFYADFTPVE
jgi:hypothetical protein